jgi:hypothetical protein
MIRIKSEHIIVTNDNILIKDYDENYYEYLIFKMIKGSDFGIELIINYK